jgi:hypothetical protein
MTNKVVGGSFEEVIYPRLTVRDWIKHRAYIKDITRAESLTLRLIKINRRKYGYKK